MVPRKSCTRRGDDSVRSTASSGCVVTARGGRLTHHNASAQVFAAGEGRSRLVWIADLLPDELAGDIRQMMELGAVAMKKALDRR